MILKIRTPICLSEEIKSFNYLMFFTNDRTVALPSSTVEGALENGIHQTILRIKTIPVLCLR